MNPRIVALSLVLLLAPRPALADGPDRLVVHEWGTFTTFAGSDGLHLEFRPLVGEDLPAFVYTSARPGTGLRSGPPCRCGSCGTSCGCAAGRRAGACTCKLCTRSKVRMETPVLYFYCARERDVSVRVGFPGGRVTEWYPQARAVRRGIDWGKIRLMPGTRPALPHDRTPSHYYPARATDAVPLRVCGGYGAQFEKFLFYRGVGNFALPLALRAEGAGRFVLDHQGTGAIRGLFLVRRAGDKLWFRRYERAGRTLELALPEQPATDAELGAAIARELVAAGLYRKEAEAMVATWRRSWFGEPGTRLLYLLPQPLTDKILPLQIAPSPDELVRVLVGRIEILTPEREAQIARLVRSLGDEAFRKREEATRALADLGRFAEPALQRAARSSADLEVRRRVRVLLERLGRAD